MLINRLIDLIRFEAGLPGTLKFAVFVKETMLEVLYELTAINLYQELLTLTGSVTITGAAQTYIALPSDYQHLVTDSVQYLPAGVAANGRYLYESEYFDFTNDGDTSRFQVALTRLNLFPNNQTAINDVVIFYYYKCITALADTDAFPIPALEATVKKKCIARLKGLLGQNPAPMQQESELSLTRSKGNGTTN